MSNDLILVQFKNFTRVALNLQNLKFFGISPWVTLKRFLESVVFCNNRHKN